MNSDLQNIVINAIKTKPKHLTFTTDIYTIKCSGKNCFIIFPLIYCTHAIEYKNGKLVNDNAELMISIFDIDKFSFNNE